VSLVIGRFDALGTIGLTWTGNPPSYDDAVLSDGKT